MKTDFLKLLACPVTGSSLTLTIEEEYANGTIKTGDLLSEEGVVYPIIRGIPRFVEAESYSKSFGYEWAKWPRVQFEDENQGKPMENHTEKMFYKATGFEKSALDKKVVIEFGCGPGRFLDVVRRANGVAIGIDLSQAVEVARKNFENDTDVLIVQGDVLSPPFKKGVFDFGFSIGVLHHTPTPSVGFGALHRVVKNNGLVACTVYSYLRGIGLYDSFSVILFRKIHNFMEPVFRNKLALLYTYFAAYVLYYPLLLMRKIPGLHLVGAAIRKLIFPIAMLPDIRWRMLDTFDAITPKYASTHTPEEVEEWYRKSGSTEVKQTAWGTSFVGKKIETSL